MTEVYVVIGYAGGDSDRSEWCVRAYAYKAEADACAARCNTYAKTEPRASTQEREAWAKANPDDPEMRISNIIDTTYGVAAVPFTG